jgi:D-cysteine desulfhydrase family pyridoxal phosphate-dependent enzyme
LQPEYIFRNKSIIHMSTRYPLGFFPTPVHPLKNLSARFPQYELYIKRDDQTGLASGGNKTRKLEYLMREALDLGSDTILTLGAQQSNHCRQTAAACNLAGLECHLMVRGQAPDMLGGNLLLSSLLGATIHYAGDEIQEEAVEVLLDSLRSRGRKPYLVPVGGSNLTGSLGFVDAAGELRKQLESMSLEIDYIFFASCSGGTQAGLVLGKEIHGLHAILMPVSIEKPEIPAESLDLHVLQLVNQGCNHLGLEKVFTLQQVALIKGYDEAGYGVVTGQERQAIHLLAKTEGILLDPVYTARAFFGMTDHLEKGLIPAGSRVLFWHTGGLPANFFYGKEIL